MNSYLSLGDHVNSTALDTNYFDIGGLNSGHLEIDVTEDIHSFLEENTNSFGDKEYLNILHLEK